MAANWSRVFNSTHLFSWSKMSNLNQINWSINDSGLKSGVYYHEGINAIALVSSWTWYIVGAKDYPLYGWKRIGDF